jgi:hypothetical protein
MMKAFGTCYRYSYDAMIDDIVECSVEEMLLKSAKSLWVLDDAINFKTEVLGSNPIGAPVEELYLNAMMKYYNQIDTPFGTQRIVRALDRVNLRLGKLHAAHESVNGAKS